MDSYKKYLKYKKKYMELKGKIMQKGGNTLLHRYLSQVNFMALHGDCLDGGMTSLLIKKDCNYDENKIIYILPSGKSLYDNLHNKQNIGIIDLALPNREIISYLYDSKYDIHDKNVLVLFNHINMVNYKLVIDHHIGSKNYEDQCNVYNNCTYMYKDDKAASMILWELLGNNNKNAHEIQRVINKGDRGELSKNDENKDEFYIYIGMQYLIELYKSSINKEENRKFVSKDKLKKMNLFSNVLDYIMTHYNNNDSKIRKKLIELGIVKFVDEYQHVKKYCNIYNYFEIDAQIIHDFFYNIYDISEGNTRNLKSDSTDAFFDSIRFYKTIYIPKKSNVTGIVVGKTFESKFIDVALISTLADDQEFKRMMLRKIYTLGDGKPLDVDLIASYIDVTGGGHPAASSAGYGNYKDTTFYYNENNDKKLYDYNNNCRKKVKTLTDNYFSRTGITRRDNIDQVLDSPTEKEAEEKSITKWEYLKPITEEDNKYFKIYIENITSESLTNLQTYFINKIDKAINRQIDSEDNIQSTSETKEQKTNIPLELEIIELKEDSEKNDEDLILLKIKIIIKNFYKIITLFKKYNTHDKTELLRLKIVLQGYILKNSENLPLLEKINLIIKKIDAEIAKL